MEPLGRGALLEEVGYCGAGLEVYRPFPTSFPVSVSCSVT